MCKPFFFFDQPNNKVKQRREKSILNERGCFNDGRNRKKRTDRRSKRKKSDVYIKERRKTNTKKQYDSVKNRWFSFCESRSENIIGKKEKK
jgi:hypothetical protein